MASAGKIQTSGNLSQKVVAIAAGEGHTLALAGDGSVFSWGRGTFGRLGTGKEADELFPVQIPFYLSNKMKVSSKEKSERERPKFVEIAAGAYHSLALEDDGSVWCWGYNISDGQLGIGAENALVPCFLEPFLQLGSPGSLADGSNSKNGTPLKVCSIKAGGMMSMAIDSLGALWIWGNCPQTSSTSDEFSLASSPIPMPVWDFHGHTVVKVACGNEHVVALVSAGETFTGADLVLYSWGSNNHGQLGLGDKESRLRPQVVEIFNQESSWDVYEVACGAFHTALLGRKKSRGDTIGSPELDTDGLQKKGSMCWTFGLGDKGQLGHGTSNNAWLPEPVRGLPRDAFLISVDCGSFHTCVVSLAGDVWSWGMEKGLGLCPDASFTGTDAGDAVSPLRVPCNELYGSKFVGPVQVACGAAHTVLVAHDGYKMWSWGRGRSGVLGTGNSTDSYAPSILLWSPLSEDFKEDELKIDGREAKIEDKDPGTSEIEKKLVSAMEEMQLLRSKSAVMEQYASILHGSIFGKPFEEQDIPESLRNSGMFDIAKEWENMLETADQGKLVRLERFYQNMLEGVKDKLMKRKVQEMVKEFIRSSTTGNQVSM